MNLVKIHELRQENYTAKNMLGLLALFSYEKGNIILTYQINKQVHILYIHTYVHTLTHPCHTSDQPTLRYLSPQMRLKKLSFILYFLYHRNVRSLHFPLKPPVFKTSLRCVPSVTQGNIWYW
jgi:hypothetical protein